MISLVLPYPTRPLGPKAGTFQGRYWHYLLDDVARTVTAMNGAPLMNRRHTDGQVIVGLLPSRGAITGFDENTDGDGLLIFFADGSHKALPYWTPDPTPGT